MPIKTYVAEYDDHLIREAILREMERNGQVFFVHNRVQSIAFIASKLQSLVPEARIAVAHGQMHGDRLETVMTDFAIGNSDERNKFVNESLSLPVSGMIEIRFLCRCPESLWRRLFYPPELISHRRFSRS